MRSTILHRSRLGGQPGADAGFALPTVIMVLTATLAVASASALFVLGAERGTARDRQSKAALTAADSGVQQALLLYNQVAPTAGAPCIGTDVNGKAVATALPGSGWCPAVTGTAGGGTFSYLLKPILATTPKTVEILSTGTANGITRRIDVTATGSDQTSNPFASAGIIGLNRVYVDSGARVIGSVGTNGTLDSGQAVLQGGGKICGSLRSPAGVFIGNGSSLVGSDCNGSVSPTTGSVSAPPLEQADIPTTLSNSRIGTTDPFSSGGGCSNGWNPTARTLTINGNCSLTLRGTNYKFCQLTLISSQAYLYLAAGVRLFFESPETCGLSGNVEQMKINPGSNVVAMANPADVALYFVGSNTQATNFHLTSNTNSMPLNCEAGLTIYAPRTDLKFEGGSHVCGSMVGKTLWVGSSAGTLVESKNSPPPTDLGFTTATKYTISKYTECAATANNGATVCN